MVLNSHIRQSTIRPFEVNMVALIIDPVSRKECGVLFSVMRYLFWIIYQPFESFQPNAMVEILKPRIER
jgi:hypothetical protein